MDNKGGMGIKEKFNQFKFYKIKAKQLIKQPSRHGMTTAFTNTPTLTGELYITRWGHKPR